MPNWCARAKSDLRSAKPKVSKNRRKRFISKDLGASAICAKSGCSLDPGRPILPRRRGGQFCVKPQRPLSPLRARRHACGGL